MGRGSCSCRACANLGHLGQDTGHCPSHTLSHRFPGPSTPSCCKAMAHSHLLLWLSSLFLFFHLTSSHLVEIPASQKECFFEDLHVNDQVHNRAFPRPSKLDSLIVLDDCHVPGWRRWPLGHRFLGNIKISPRFPYPSLPNSQINDPTGSAIKKNIRYSTGTSSITAEKDGRYEYCFSNQMSTIADKIVRCVFVALPCQSVLGCLILPC